MHLPWGFSPGKLEGSCSFHCRHPRKHCSGRRCAGSASSAGQASCLWWLQDGSKEPSVSAAAGNPTHTHGRSTKLLWYSWWHSSFNIYTYFYMIQTRKWDGNIHLWFLLLGTPARQWLRNQGNPNTPGISAHPDMWLTCRKGRGGIKNNSHNIWGFCLFAIFLKANLIFLEELTHRLKRRCQILIHQGDNPSRFSDLLGRQLVHLSPTCLGKSHFLPGRTENMAGLPPSRTRFRHSCFK